MRANISQSQRDQAALAAQDLKEAVDRLLADGFDLPCLQAGLAMAVCETLDRIGGPAHTAMWLAVQASLALEHWRAGEASQIDL